MVSGDKLTRVKQKIGTIIFLSGHHYICQQKRRKAENGKAQIKDNQCQQIKAFFPWKLSAEAETKTKPNLI